jgi:hypothetical protein
MFRASQRLTLEAIDTRAITPIVPLARFDLKRSIAQSKSIELPSSHAIFLLHAREVGALIEKAAAAR